VLFVKAPKMLKSTFSKYRSNSYLIVLFSVLIIIESVLVFQFRISRFGTKSNPIDSLHIFSLCSFLIGLLFFLTSYFALSNPLRKVLKYGPTTFFLVLVICGLTDIWTSNSRFFSYGDKGELFDSVSSINSEGNPRWILGSFFLAFGRWTIDTFIFSIDVQRFIETSGALIFLATSILVLVRSKGRASFILPLFVPIWLSFGTGYDEYQPFLAPIALLIFLHILTQDPNRTIIPEIVIVGLLPAIYVGFLPLSILFFSHAFRSKPIKAILQNMVLAMFVYLIAIEISWSLGVRNYFHRLPSSLQLGDAGPGAITGESLNSRSMFFDLRSALSSNHLNGLLYMLILGGGVFALIFVVLTLIHFVKRIMSDRNIPSISIRELSAMQILTISWCGFFLIFWMAKLGSSGDLDSFYTTYFAFAILLGVSIDRWSTDNNWTVKKKALISGAICSLNAPMFLGLVVLGVNQSCDLYSTYRVFC
jgi:hypothetical protein